MRSPLTYVGLLSFLVLTLPGCAENRRSDSLEDDLGRTLQVDLPAERVATLAPNLTEIVFAAGAGRLLVGVGKPDDFPPAVDTLPRYSTYPVDFEALAALAPDLVLATSQVNSPRDAETLQALDIPTYFFSFHNLDDVLDGITTVGLLLGTSETARRAADSLRQAARALRSRTQNVAHRPRVLYIIGPETSFSFGRESYVHELIDMAGGQSITADIETAAPVLSDEYILMQHPDVILGPWENDLSPSDLLEHHPTWSVLPAIRDGRVYGVNASLIERPGPRIIEGARRIARKLHPSLFSSTQAP